MRILIINNKNGLSSVSGKLIVATLCVTFGLGVVAYYIVNGALQKDFHKKVIQDLRMQIALDREDIEQTKRDTQDKVDALSAHVGSITSRLMRLEAVGARVADAVQVDRDEFALSQPPGLGGPASSEAGSSETLDELTRNIKNITAQLDEREEKIWLLETLVDSKKIASLAEPRSTPVKGGWISSLFGFRNDPFTGKREFHQGIYISGTRGTPILAAADGIVVFSGKKDGYGNVVEISHGNGFGTRYGHNFTNVAKVGQRVKKGELVAHMGSTGRSTGDHVHFEVIKDGKYINPSKYLMKKKATAKQ